MDGIVEELKLVVVSFLVKILDSGLCINSANKPFNFLKGRK